MCSRQRTFYVRASELRAADNPSSLTVYLAANIGPNLRYAARVINACGAHVIDAYVHDPGAMRRSDAVIAVTTSAPGLSVQYDIGQALGLKKPLAILSMDPAEYGCKYPWTRAKYLHLRNLEDSRVIPFIERFLAADAQPVSIWQLLREADLNESA